MISIVPCSKYFILCDTADPILYTCYFAVVLIAVLWAITFGALVSACSLPLLTLTPLFACQTNSSLFNASKAIFTNDHNTSVILRHFLKYISLSCRQKPNARLPAGSSVDGVIYAEPRLSVWIIVAIVVAAIILLAIVIDVLCFFSRDSGVTSAIARKIGSKEKDKEAMLEPGKNNR